MRIWLGSGIQTDLKNSFYTIWRNSYSHTRNKPKDGAAQIIITPLLQKHDQEIQGREKDHFHDHHIRKTRAFDHSDESTFQ